MDKNTTIDQYKTQRPLYKKLANKVALIIEELLELENVNYHVVTYRTKTVDSFSIKIKKPKYNGSLNELTDLAGIRIIGYVEDDVKQIAHIIENLFDIDTQNSSDKSIELGVDKVGYKSVHYVCSLPISRTSLPEYARFANLKFEIQIRTILQHSWAEIEHDKNYKFSGELPPEIQRRFKLVAGNLELADREFNQLSKDIDSYIKSIQQKTESGDLNIKLNSTALKQFLTIRFEKLIESNQLTPDFNGSENESEILQELRDFGLETLSDLDKIIDKRIIKTCLDLGIQSNFLGISRDIMMINDWKKYMSKSFKNHWAILDLDSVQLLTKLGLNVENIYKQLPDKEYEME